jgi:hypothetical protein
MSRMQGSVQLEIAAEGHVSSARGHSSTPSPPLVSTSTNPPLPTMAPANFNDTFALAYGSITLIGGLIGYLKANSFAS